MPFKHGYIANIITVFFIFAVTVPTIWYLFNKDKFNHLNSFTPPDMYAPPSATPTSGIANPASLYCGEQGGKSEIVTNIDGSQSGHCIFPNGTVCEEWTFYRHECGPTAN